MGQRLIVFVLCVGILDDKLEWLNPRLIGNNL